MTISAAVASLAFVAACSAADARTAGTVSAGAGTPATVSADNPAAVSTGVPGAVSAGVPAAVPDMPGKATVPVTSPPGTAALGAGPGTAALGTGAAAPAAPKRCRTDALSARIGTADAGAGQRYAPLVLTNTGSRPCWVYGFTGLIMIDGNGDALRTRTRRESVQPRRVTLRPGASAHARLHWTVVPTGKETTCPRSARLMIIPPDEVAHLEIPFDAMVCGDGRIDVRPMEPGTRL